MAGFVIAGHFFQEVVCFFSKLMDSKNKSAKKTLGKLIVITIAEDESVILELRGEENLVIKFSSIEFKEFLILFYNVCTRVLYCNPKQCILVKAVVNNICKTTKTEPDAISVLKTLAKGSGQIKLFKNLLKTSGFDISEQEYYELLHIFSVDARSASGTSGTSGILYDYMHLGCALKQMKSNHWKESNVQIQHSTTAQLSTAQEKQSCEETHILIPINNEPLAPVNQGTVIDPYSTSGVRTLTELLNNPMLGLYEDPNIQNDDQ